MKDWSRGLDRNLYSGDRRNDHKRPFLMMAINSQIPITAAAVNPAIPITDTPKSMGGASELMRIADPSINAAIMIEKEILLLV